MIKNLKNVKIEKKKKKILILISTYLCYLVLKQVNDSSFQKDPYQTLITRHFNPAATVSGYPYGSSMPYRLPPESLAMGHPTQRIPPLIPMDTPDKRLAPNQRYDPAQANYTANYARRVSLDQYSQLDQQQYARMIAASSQQQQVAKVSTPEMTVTQGRQYKNSSIYVHSVPTTVSRNGSTIGKFFS